jgi:hypothetical protein
MPATRTRKAAIESTATGDGQAVAHLEVTRPVRVDPAALRGVLERPSWLGRLVDPPAGRGDHRRVETDLAFSMGADGRTLTFSKAALVDIGPLVEVADGWAADIGWQATSLAPLFPVFAGRLVAGPSRLRLVGKYAPPGGGVGLLVDRAILHHFAQRTAGSLLDRLVAEIRR